MPFRRSSLTTIYRLTQRSNSPQGHPKPATLPYSRHMAVDKPLGSIIDADLLALLQNQVAERRRRCR